MVDESVVYSAPGKIILFGEHAVVYGYPAIVAAIDRRVSCKVTDSPTQQTLLSSSIWSSNYVLNADKENFVEEKSMSDSTINRSYFFIVNTLLRDSSSTKVPGIHLDSNIPIEAGLGSSAAISVSMVACLTDFLELPFTLEQINELAFNAEKITHGDPSGVDNTISTYGGIQFYKEQSFKQISTSAQTFQVVVANSKTVRKTKELVERVANFKNQEPRKFNRIMDDIGKITLEASTYLSKGNFHKIGELMSTNHILLNELGVGHPSIEQLRQIFQQTDSLGSKLTGAGGGGCAIGLYDNVENAKEAVATIESTGYEAFISNFNEKGVKREH